MESCSLSHPSISTYLSRSIRNLAFQQNVPGLLIAVVVLQAKSNRLSDIRRLVPGLLSKLDSAQPGAVTIVG